MFSRRAHASASSPRDADHVIEKPTSKSSSREPGLPQHNGDVAQVEEGDRQSPVTPGIKAAGESYRRGIHPIHFLRISFRSSSKVSRAVNVLWPVVPAAIAVKYARPDWHQAIFILTYIAMVPCANLIGFAGQVCKGSLPVKSAHLHANMKALLGARPEILPRIVRPD
jgi:Ca2+:H+ antiporter